MYGSHHSDAQTLLPTLVSEVHSKTIILIALRGAIHLSRRVQVLDDQLLALLSTFDSLPTTKQRSTKHDDDDQADIY